MRWAGTVLAALAAAGCGEDDEAEPVAPAGENAAIERRLTTYFERNFSERPWYGDLRGFEVRGGRPLGAEQLEDATVLVHTTLTDGDDDAAAQEACLGVFGADAVDAGGRVRVVDESGDDVHTCLSDS